MGALGPASIVVIPFPFSDDLSTTKRRPALVLTKAGNNDWLLCQITSKDTDPIAIRLTDTQLSRGTLQTNSFARPMKLFTASIDLIIKHIAILNDETFQKVLTTIIDSLQRSMPLP